MHPAASVVFFTVVSGAGYGLLAAAGLAAASGLFAAHPALGVVALTLALGLVAAGLLASTLHLGHPERAWRALSQWRTSWLSREGVAALATFVPAGGLWLAVAGGARGGATAMLLGIAAAAGAAVTVWCTGMIYAVLKPIPRWHQAWTVPAYLAFAAATGLVLWHAHIVLLGPPGARTGTAVLALLALGAAALVKWQWLAEPGVLPSRAAALGLAGRARPLDPPHTGTSYLLDEMGYRVARRHAARLSRLMWLLGLIVPALLVLLSLLLLPGLLALLAAASALVGTAVERWLFFATAEHAVTLYYR
jgi:DMSO reductase anchor subunit